MTSYPLHITHVIAFHWERKWMIKLFKTVIIFIQHRHPIPFLSFTFLSGINHHLIHAVQLFFSPAELQTPCSAFCYSTNSYCTYSIQLYNFRVDTSSLRCFPQVSCSRIWNAVSRSRDTTNTNGTCILLENNRHQSAAPLSDIDSPLGIC